MALLDLANPSRFLKFANAAIPWLAGVTVLVFAFALEQAMIAPDDYQQGATVKIMYLHVPSAWLGMLCWGLMSVAALGTLVWRHPLADVTAKAAAPIGAAFTLLCLVTGSLWGRPEWGTYWVWDARLTSELVLFLLYLAVIALMAHGRGSVARGARGGGAHAGRRHRSADHQIFGRLVEHAASRRVGVPRRRLDDLSDNSAAAFHHGRSVHFAVCHAACWRRCATKFCAAACAQCDCMQASAAS